MTPYIYEITQLKSPHFPWQVIAYLFANGIASGTYIIAALLQAYGGKMAQKGLHKAYYITFCFLPFCGAFLIGKLEVKSRFINVLWNSRDGVLMLNANSPMSWGAWVLTVFSVIGTLSVIYAITEDGLIRWKWFQKLGGWVCRLYEGNVGSKIYLTVTSALAAWFGSYLGVLVTTSNVPTWNTTPFIPMLWIVSAVLLGATCMMLALSFSKGEGYGPLIQGLNRIAVSALIINVAAIIVFVISLGEWFRTINSGHFGWLLWGVAVLLGLLLPLAIKLIPRLSGSKSSLIISSLLILLGSLALRYVVIMGPQSFW